MDNLSKVRQPYCSPVLRPLGTLADVTQGLSSTGDKDSSGAPYCGRDGGDYPGTGGSGASL